MSNKSASQAMWNKKKTHALIDEQKKQNRINTKIKYENFINIFTFSLINSI